jgi:hypothetical protein
MVLKLNFSDPLYVSSEREKDTVSMQFPAPELFVALSDSLMLADDYQI